MESCCLSVSRSDVRDWSCSGVGAEVDNCLSEFNWSWSCPNSSCRELIVESFSDSEDLKAAISFSLAEDEVEF